MPLPDGWVLTPYRAVVHAATATAVMADLHLGYAAQRQALGEAVPLWPEDAIRHRLQQIIDQYRIRRLVIAGDMVERGLSGHNAATSFVHYCHKRSLEMILVEGNHDQGLNELKGVTRLTDSMMLNDVCIRHEIQDQKAGFTIVGHYHPVLRSGPNGRRIPCYLANEHVLILPAQSEDASGINVLKQKSFSSFHCHAIVHGRVLDLGPLGQLKKQLLNTHS